MIKKKSIGGYFELELNKGQEYHKNALALNTGRNCLEYILRVRKYEKVYIPYYTCEVILEPLKKLKIQHDFYNINKDLDPPEISLMRNEAILYTNYFGIKSNTVKKLSKKYKNLIIDNTQAFFDKPEEGVDTFYSPRKFFGVPDGGYLYINKFLKQKFEKDISFNRFSHLIKRIDAGAEEGYNDFKFNDKSLSGQPIKLMSNLTKNLLKGINYNDVKRKRRRNFMYLAKRINIKNKLKIDININVPLAYPLLFENIKLRQKLLYHKIYVPIYWKNVLNICPTGNIENSLVNKLIPIPIDQRISISEIDNIINFLIK